MKTQRLNHGYENKSKAEALLHTSMRERYCLSKFFDALNVKAKYRKFECVESPVDSACSYDATLKIYNKQQELVSYSIIEVKVREELHSDYFFEKMKKEALYKSKADKDIQLKLNGYDLECDILYINFLWNGVYVWDILELESLGKIKRGKRHMMNKQTVVSRTEKTLKSVYHLETNTAKFFTDFMFSNKQFLSWYNESRTPQPATQFTNETKTFNLLSLFDKK